MYNIAAEAKIRKILNCSFKKKNRFYHTLDRFYHTLGQEKRLQSGTYTALKLGECF